MGFLMVHCTQLVCKGQVYFSSSKANFELSGHRPKVTIIVYIAPVYRVLMVHYKCRGWFVEGDNL